MARKRRPKGDTPIRRVNAKDSAVAPLATKDPSKSPWILLGVIALLVLAALLTVVRPWGRSSDGVARGDGGDRVPLPPPTVRFASATTTPDDFVGADACASCHRTEYNRWRTSTHGNAGGTPSPATVIAPFNGAPIRFRDAEVLPTSAGGTYRFVVRQHGREARTYRVDGVIGKGHMQGGGTQGFVSKFADGTYRFIPFDFHRETGKWFCNTEARGGHGWQPITPALALADCGDWPPARVLGDEVRYTNCQSCHGSQITVTLDSANARTRTRFTSLALNCESCHGPGRRHLALVRDAKAIAAGDVGMTPLETLSKDGSLGVCWSCHALKDHLRDGYLPGETLEDFYAIRTPQLGERAHLADGRVRTFAYQEGHLWSDCYVNGGMTCTSCHDPHSQGYRDVIGTPLPGRFDDRQCTSCHQAKAAAPQLHTRHAPASAGSRCVSCHMPYLQEPQVGTTLRYSRSDHTIPIPRPKQDGASGITSACRGCHTERTEAALDTQVRAWYGELKPVARGIAAAQRIETVSDRREAAALVLHPDERHTAALFAGMAQFAERFLAADMPDVEDEVIARLDSLGDHPNADVRALALASLHLAAGERGGVRARLAAHLQTLGADERRVRSRWALVLGFFGDRARGAGDVTAAATIYRKALEVDPDNARIYQNLGVALSQGGDFGGAVASLKQSLTLAPRQPLTQVNLGIALASQGDKEGAIAAYREALRLNAHEPLAWFNLGNALFELGRQGEAESAYAKAVEGDPSMPVAHFYLARTLANRGELARALREAEAGLEFAPDDPQALEARQRLRQLIAGGGAK